MKWMLENPSDRYIISGFPRSLVQAKLFEKYVPANVVRVISNDVTDK
jgi:adenylate kinase family enzyme